MHTDGCRDGNSGLRSNEYNVWADGFDGYGDGDNCQHVADQSRDDDHLYDFDLRPEPWRAPDVHLCANTGWWGARAAGNMDTIPNYCGSGHYRSRRPWYG